MKIPHIKNRIDNLLYLQREAMNREPNHEMKIVLGAMKKAIDEFGNKLVDELQQRGERANQSVRMTKAQRDALWDLCGRYNVPFNENDYFPSQFNSNSPVYYENWVGGNDYNGDAGRNRKTIYVGVSPDGEINS